MAPPVADYVPMFKAPPQTKINLGRMLFHPSSTLQTLVEFMPSQRLTKTLCMAFLLHSLLLKKQSLPKSNATGGETQG